MASKHFFNPRRNIYNILHKENQVQLYDDVHIDSCSLKLKEERKNCKKAFTND